MDELLKAFYRERIVRELNRPSILLGMLRTKTNSMEVRARNLEIKNLYRNRDNLYELQKWRFVVTGEPRWDDEEDDDY